MKAKIFTAAAAVLLAAGLSGCASRYDVYLTPKEGGASGHGKMIFSDSEQRIQVSADGKHYDGRAVCSFRDEGLFKLGYFKCSAQMNSGNDTMVCEFELSAHGVGNGECTNSAGKVYAVQVSL